MQEQDIIRFSTNQRAAIAALGDCGIPSWDAQVEPGTESPASEPASRRASPVENISVGRSATPRQRRTHRAWSSLRFAVVLGDLCAVIATPMLCHFFSLGSWVPDTAGLAFIEVSCILALCGLHFAGAYTREALQRPVQAWTSVFLAQAAPVLGVIGFAFVNHSVDDVMRAWVVTSWAASAALLLTIHLGVTALVARVMKAGHLRERVAIVCTGPRAKMVLEKFRAAAAPEVLIVGVFDDRKDRIPAEFESYGVKGDTDNLLSYIRHNAIDRVIVTIPWSAEQRIIKLVSKLRQTPVRVDLIPDKLIWEFPSDVHRIHGVPTVTVANNRVDDQMDWLKRAEDLLLGIGLLVVAAPLMLAVAVAIRLESPGPVLFRQKRSGFNNATVEVYKFRSMYANRPADPVVQQATKDDPRVTRVGRLIRRTSLDELPQLLNVVMGTMSLVGPRPHALPHNDYFGRLVDGYFARHNVKPGITGWAQVNGYRGETDTVEKMTNRVRYDLEYIDRWSLLLDLKIIILTAIRIWFQKTAY